MPAVHQTRRMDTDQPTMWKIISDLVGYKEWLVLPSGRVVEARITQDAGVLTRSERRLEVEGGQWFEELVAEASAPSYVQFRVLRDNTGKFASTYKDMVISVKAIGAPEGGVNVSLSVTYTKASFLGRWTDWFGPRNWRRAFTQSLKRLETVVESHAKPEVFTPTWRQPAPAPEVAPPPAPAAPAAEEAPPEAAPSEKEIAADAFAVAAEEAAPEPDREALENQLAQLRGVLEQSRALGLPTGEIEARIADIEARLGA
ncbi:MAG: SRPBCC family protein [Anaerolineae bacterium]|nr:SRPBCC family protein [Anaerolineae bacterium]